MENQSSSPYLRNVVKLNGGGKFAKRLNVFLEKKWTVVSVMQGKNNAQYTRESH